MSGTSPQTRHLVIACGGTGGHLFPGVAVAEEWLTQGGTATLMISPKEVDQRGVGLASPTEIVTLPAVAMQRGSRLAFVTALVGSVRMCVKHFRTQRPAAVLAMGGFTSAGPVLAARALRIPAFLHESNTVPGRANRLLARCAQEVFVGFPGAAARFRTGATPTGTPVRTRFGPADEAGCRRSLGLEPDRPVILVAGGSQGARGVNDIVLRALPGAKSMLPHWQWLHLTGPAEEDRVRRAYAAEGIDGVVHGFWDRMETALGAASAAVCRAGASSLAELAAMRVPTVLIPFPHAADNHQFYNACAFESTGASVLIEQKDLQPEHLLAALRPMVEDSNLRIRMQAALEVWNRPDAARSMIDRMLGRTIPSTVRVGASESESTALPRRKALVA